MRLPFVLAPEADESARGFIVRVAEKNGVSSDQMCEWLELPMRSKPLTGSPVHAAEMMAVDPAVFERMGFDQGDTGWVLGLLMPLPFLWDYRLRVCPACLSEKPYHRRIWDLRHVENCPRHRTPLLTHCPDPDCPGELRWSRWSLTACFCGRSLARTEGLERAGDCEAEEVIYSRANVPGHSFTLPEFDRVPLLELLELLLFLGRMDQVAASENPNHLSRKRLFTDRSVLAKGLEIVQGWPASFDELASRMRAGRPSQVGVSRQYGPIHRFIEKHGSTSYAGALRQAYRDHLIRRGDIEPSWFPAFLDPPERVETHLVTANELREMVGQDQTTFARLMKGPWGQMLKPVPGAGTGLPVYQRSDVDELLARLARLVSFREADRILGLRNDSTRELIAAGIIEAPFLLTKSKLDGSALDRLVVEQLFERIRSLSVAPRPVAPVSFALVWGAASRRLPAALAEVFKGLLDGELQGHIAFPDQPGLRSLVFEQSEVESFLVKLVSRSRTGKILMPDVGPKLSIRPEAVRWLVRAGYLPGPEREWQRLFFRTEVIEQFAETYVSTTELAARSGTDASAVRNALARQQIEPALEFVVRGRTTTLYRKADMPTLSQYALSARNMPPSKRAGSN